jgi:DNA-binding protein HU-beta
MMTSSAAARSLLLLFCWVCLLISSAEAFIKGSSASAVRRGLKQELPTASRLYAVAKKSKAKKSKAAANAKKETFKKSDFVAAVSEKTGLNKKESTKAMQAVLDVIMEEVSAGKRISLPGFGTFTLKERAARKGRNPQTGEELEIAASKSPGFSAAKSWKDEINGRT